jgi:hypothetical protein
MGVYLGDEREFFPANENNLGGYYEIRALQELNLRGYAVFGMNFFQVDRLPSTWKDVPGSLAFMEDLRSMLRSRFAGRPNWGWKEPATTGLMPIYEELLSQEGLAPRYAICVRHPLSVAGSQIARQKKWGLDPPEHALRGLNPPIGEHTLGLWLHYTLSGLVESRGKVRQVVSYEHFLQNPEATIHRLVKGLLAHEPTKDQIAAAIASVKPEWSHNRYTLEDLQAWPSLVARTYDVCLRAEQDSESFNAGKFDSEIDDLWGELGLMGKLVKPIQLPAGQMMLSWKQGDRPAGYAEKYSPTGAWQSLRIPVAAPAGAVIQIDPYQTPCQIWIRKAVWNFSGESRVAALKPGPNGVMEDVSGMKRLTVFGPGPLLAQMPNGTPAEFEFEFMVQSGQIVLGTVVSMLRGGIEQAKRASAQAMPQYGRR